ncbi:MAG: energy transducer TonB [Methylococcales bacterium]|nr:energy transducer TonB [Methylococcales bacterium]
MTQKKHWRVYVPKLAAGLLVALLIGIIVYFIGQMDFKKAGKKEKKVQTISLVKPPPPPPPPPPKEKIPPPPEVKEKIDQPLPKDEPEPEPEPVEEAAEEPAGDTGLDAEGTAGSDGFGLVGRKGGRGLLGSGGGSPTAWYAGVVKNQLVGLLSGKDELRRSKFVVTVSVWFDLEGNVQRFELVKPSNDAKIDELLATQLAKLKKINKVPPAGIKSPVKLRITSR